jgi:hypothetical protein
MKIKAIVFTGVFLMGLIFMGTHIKDAGAELPTVPIECQVVWIGTQHPAATNHRIRLTHVPTEGEPVFVNQLFVLKPEVANQMLAISLTAMSLGKNIVVMIDDDGLTLTRLWVSNE